jgi:hypothetical protein
MFAIFYAVDVSGSKTLVKYLYAQYCQARNCKTTTGWHVPFSSSVGGKICLIYWHPRLKTAGNNDLNHCMYSTLNEGIHHISGEMPKALQQKSRSSLSTASEYSLSPIPELYCVRNRKHALVDATEDAA